ncbi:MAG: carbonic anhydrase [Myxococcales bacterium SG8_38]|nr:MAG: carbonic anhydrase [Myxococcales bacterium SG8_38]
MTIRLTTAAAIVVLLSQGCEKEAARTTPTPRVETVLTQEERDNLKPDEIVESFRAGNRRFMAGDLTVRDHSAQVRAAASGQFPKAVVLSCLDSRVPVEDVFDRGIGDIFVARVAGNFENIDILGSMEFGTKVVGAKVILVLGHEDCGAVMGAIDGVELGNITPMLANIQPAVQTVSNQYEGDKSSTNHEFVHLVTEENVRQTIRDIRQRSEIVRDMEAAGDLMIVGGVYDMKTGEVEFLD